MAEFEPMMIAKQIYEVKIKAVSEEFNLYQVVANTPQEAKELAELHAQTDWSKWSNVSREITGIEIAAEYVMETNHKDGAVF